MRKKRRDRVERSTKLRPTSIHIFEDLEKRGAFPDEALTSYKSLARNQRLGRTMEALYSIDSKVAKEVFKSSTPLDRPTSAFDFRSPHHPVDSCPPSMTASLHHSFAPIDADDPLEALLSGSPLKSPGCTEESERLFRRIAAAVCIQRHWRGFCGRRQYAARLYEAYAEEEERQRQRLTTHFDEETEILMEARKAKLEIEERETVQRNAARLLVSRVITIQRAWRAHRAAQVRAMPVLAPSRLQPRPRQPWLSADDHAMDMPPSFSCNALSDICGGGGGGKIIVQEPLAETEPDDCLSELEIVKASLLSQKTDAPGAGRRLPASTSVASKLKRLVDDDGFFDVLLHDVSDHDPVSLVGTRRDRVPDIDAFDLDGFDLPALKALATNLVDRVEYNNEQLMRLLQERDQLHMEQDSMMVDIEDLIKKCKKQAELQARKSKVR